MVRTKDVVLMATVSSYEGMGQPGRHELKQFSELFEPLYKASSPEARRNAVAALARAPMLPQAVALFVGSQPIEIAALFLTRSPAIDDETLIAIARHQGSAHARAIAARENLSVKVVDALVSLHQGNAGTRAPVDMPPVAAAHPATPIESREEDVRRQLRSLVERETIASAEDSNEARAEMHSALLIRFARLRQVRDFSYLLSNMLGSSQWLSNRILLDISGLQLATALIALDIEASDGIFVLKQFYPHLEAISGNVGRAEALWHGLDADDCIDRLTAWIRADDYTQGKTPQQNAANANRPAPALPAQRPSFGHMRGIARR
jgi:uncharacterized protein (DUF2336 family)